MTATNPSPSLSAVPSSLPAGVEQAAPGVDLQNRANAIQDAFRAETSAAKAARRAEAAAPPDPPSPTDDDSRVVVAPEAIEAAPVATVDAAAERKARIAKVRAEEAAKVDRKAKQAEGDRYKSELEKERAARAELQAIVDQRVDPNSLDEAGFFDLAERLKIAPQKLGEFIASRINNPDDAIIEKAKAAVSPEVAALREELAAVKASLAQQAEERAAMQEQQTEAEAERAFVTHITESKTAPLTAKFREKAGHEQFMKVVLSAAKTLPPGSGYQALADKVEDQFEQLAALYAAPPEPTPTAPSNGKKSPPSAAAKATTLTNALASARTDIVEEEDLSALTYDQRVARVKKLYG